MATLIRGGWLIDGTGRAPLPDSSVLIEGDRIVAIGAPEDFGARSVHTTIDARGMFIMPGLVDAHVHLMHEVDRMATLYLAAGVTTARDTGSALAPVVEWCAAQQSGAARGPRLVFTGPLLDRAPPIHPAVTSIVDSPDSARAEVERFAAAGAGAIKIYSQIEPDLLGHIVDAARERGLPAIGDLAATTASEAIRAGIYGLEHASVAYGDLVPIERQTSWTVFHAQGAAVWRREWNRGFGAADGAGPQARALARLFADTGVYLDPTLVVLERLANLDDPRITDTPAVQQVPESVRAFWTERSAGRKQYWHAEDYVDARRAFQTAVAFTSEVMHAGGRLLVGSDAPNPFVVPGDALHRELELLVAAGLSPMAVLVAATRGNAEALRLERELGTLEAGKLADILLLSANPLDDIRNSRQIHRVFQAGRIVAGDT